jgi:hypothetical protein
MNDSDWKLLEPFLRAMKGGDKASVELLYTYRSKRFYYVSFGIKDPECKPSMVVKVYQQEDRAAAFREIENLRWAEEVQKDNTGYRVKIPELQWSNASLGMLATRWIPGRNLDTTLYTDSRIWSPHSSERWKVTIIKLIKWLESFSSTGQELPHPKSIDMQDDTNWDEWTTWLAETNHFDKEWRRRVKPMLHHLRHNIKQNNAKGSFQHGDFAPRNIRIDPEGNIYVMDWGGLEIEDWLSPAYRFYYALRISALSPLAKPRYYKSIYKKIAEFIKTRQQDEESRRYYRARAVLQHIKYICRSPTSMPKKYMIKRFLIKELNFLLEASLVD